MVVGDYLVLHNSILSLAFNFNAASETWEPVEQHDFYLPVTCNVPAGPTYKDLEDYKLNLSVKTSLLSSLVKVEALDKENSCGILTLKQESTNKADIDFPDTNSTFIDVSDSNALDNYISNFNIESFINDFASRANLDISYSDIVSDTLGYYSSLKNDYNASDYNFSDFDASDYNTSDFDISDYDSSDFDSSDSYISDYTSDLDIY